ncbi:saccharopine dehydrogenase NADP-binding domain-containing protein [Salipiger sp. P9]|uniref:saccharopine dehydrogenase C-terminal domain-containing protein n=1 Tax=Salipiger pentaromativorans TaxID=2943193 RepID=UPI00215770D5|nr:saccharopine dehydrogenase C-terminal domain-containing protein [Salipiger pentaromativorans]MCR8547654.1 saccharopine dehydrogenase NADP-binding domain-containing protein [Salipiger pentaromativorans]
MIHWCGTGLSSVPGLRRLIADGHEVTAWNRTPEKARAAVGDLTDAIRVFDLPALEAALAPGDVVVSMLPADWHVPLAELAISKGAHFVSSSYIAPEMRALDSKARAAGVALVNEVGLDPGIDHLMAHDLVRAYRASDAFDAENALSFVSYCGGVPKQANAFRYKFSWAPVGVLKALRSPSRSIRHFTELNVARPWDALGRYDAPLDPPESFEVYPNRDSLPFIAQYEFGPDWTVKDFVRGTLRLNGWAEAWKEIFAAVETADDAALADLAAELLEKNAYEEGEPDRVVLCVSLKAEKAGATVWHKTWVMDAWGDARGTAMARLVSVPVSLAIEAVLNREIAPGVSAAPSDPKLVTRWLGEVQGLAQRLMLVDEG